MNKPVVSLIAAMAKNRIIGKNKQMPWHLPADLKHFKAVTLGKPIIMGRRTFESIGKPLPGRRNIVVSKNPNFKADGCDLTDSLESALALVNDVKEIMIIGGGLLYSQALNFADKLYLTFIDLEVEGDTQFPDYSSLKLTEVAHHSHTADEHNPHDYTFVDYQVTR